MTSSLLNAIDTVSILEKNKMVNFLKKHDDSCTDSNETILNAIEYALNDFIAQGGFIVQLKNQEEELIGLAVVNKIATRGYFPENILVYLSVHKNYHNNGNEEKLLDEVLNYSKGSISFHVSEGSQMESIARKIGFKETCKELRFSK